MSDGRPVYVLAPDGAAALPPGLVPGHEPVPLAHPGELRGRKPGLLLLPVRDLPADQIVAALRAAAEAAADAPWLPVLIEPDAKGGVRALPVSLGWPAEPTELARWAEGDLGADVLELRHVLKRVARARHDLNNPLTSAMAETQLAHMGAKDAEVRTGLETVDQQLRRMRDLIAALKALRAPL